MAVTLAPARSLLTLRLLTEKVKTESMALLSEVSEVISCIQTRRWLVASYPYGEFTEHWVVGFIYAGIPALQAFL